MPGVLAQIAFVLVGAAVVVSVLDKGARLAWFRRLPVIRVVHVFVALAAVVTRWRRPEVPTSAELSAAAQRAFAAATGDAATRLPTAADCDSQHADRFHEAALAALRADAWTYSPIDKWVFPWQETLVRKLQVLRALREHPEIGAVEVRRPVWIVGLPRTGSTFAHKLLALDPAARTPRAWELRFPYPPPDADDLEGVNGEQLRRADKFLANVYKMFPKLQGIHHIGATDPDECCEGFLDPVLPQRYLWGAHAMPRAYKWFMGTSMRPLYAGYRRLLQVLSWRAPARSHTLLKSPHHTAKLADIAAEFPGSAFVWLHRDLEAVVGSTCSMNLTVSEYFESFFTPKEVMGARTLRRLAAVHKQGLAQRRELEQQGVTFVDVDYAALKADTPGTVARVYEELGLSVSPAFRAAMDEFLAAQELERSKPRGRLTRIHTYTLEEYGLTKEEVERAFSG